MESDVAAVAISYESYTEVLADLIWLLYNIKNL